MASQSGWNTGGILATPRITIIFVIAGIVLSGLSLGGCPGASQVIPISPGSTSGGSSLPNPSTGSGNPQPIIAFLDPTSDQEVSPGDTVAITWTVSDGDADCQYSVVLDPDSVPNNGNEIVLVTGYAKDVPSGGQTYLLKTTSLTPATYFVRCTANDGVNPTVQVTAAGRVRLFPAGLQHKNRPPFITVTEPSSVHGVVQGDKVRIAWCARDLDDVAQVLVLLDYDDNPDNDAVIFHTEAEVNAICQGTLPRQVQGAILLSCSKENDCTDTTKGDSIDWVIDVSDIPPRADGLPYRVRVDVTDETTDNPTVHAYAPGGIMVLPTVNTAIVDVGQIGRTLGGAAFQGFDAGSRLGQAFTRVPDLNDDGADEFLMVAQYGRPFERGPVGSAYLVFGRPVAQAATDVGSRFAGLIPANSITTTIPGVTFTGPHCEATEGITSVSYVTDLDDDKKVELLFGMPRVQGMPDWHDDNPCPANPPGCYVGAGRTGFGTDLLPNPLAPDSTRDITAYDGGGGGEGVSCPDPAEALCSNDQDLGTLTPIISGYMIYVSSKNLVTPAVTDQTDPTIVVTPSQARNIFVGLEDIGLINPDDSNPGARFRGAWYEFDLSQVEWPYGIVPNTRFGDTVASMPGLTTGWDDGLGIPYFPATCEGVSYRGNTGYGNGPARDNVPEVLTSAPMGRDGRGTVLITFGQDFDQFEPDTWRGQNSIPHYYTCVPCPSTCAKPRGLRYPGFRLFTGSAPGDHLGYAWAAGDFNLDGSQDILMGAPGASREGLNGNGLVYILFGRIDIPTIDFSAQNPPRVEIHGVTAGEGLGEVNRLLDDVNGDGLPDIGLGSPKFSPPGLPNAGSISVVFGGRQLTGENIFNETQIATNQLPGTRFLGTQSGGLAGSKVTSAGDFNADGYGDILIVAPNETHPMGGQVRRGAVYLIFGGRHLYNKTFLLSQVGTTQLPGMVFISPFAVGGADEAALESAEGVGDVDGDGFGDVMIGAPAADYIYPSDPSQRRIDAGEAYLIYGTNDVTPIGG